MDEICLVFPILPGKTAEARAFQRALAGDHNADYGRSEQRLGITKELWYIAPFANGDLLVAYLETADFHHALQSFIASQDPFDAWFKDHLATVTGVDLNNPPPDLPIPELLSRYEAARVSAS